ncbi:hypothetical protein [Tautonia plasticadhaerens]|uniref:Uncharacterized protein n=1 Tax=Tautonia plasticadhaerens TaxID=2527974 RepID=A0A518GZT6_9BACT|nr:hypothetical protein [Tautonia plasticadhaerens]QDV34101.1 hypothetical protein ElP_19830 [Tautonia plasticadhaerens]
MSQTNTQPAESGAGLPTTQAEIEALLERAHRGDQSCLPQLRSLLSDPKRGRWFLDHYGDPPAWLFDAIARGASGKDLAIKESLRLRLGEVRRDLEGPNPTPMERLLAERAALCWAEVNIRQTNYEQSKDLTLRQAEFHQRRIDAAHRRFLSAIKTLATVRKLALPALRVNLAQNQVNVG